MIVVEHPLHNTLYMKACFFFVYFQAIMEDYLKIEKIGEGRYSYFLSKLLSVHERFLQVWALWK